MLCRDPRLLYTPPHTKSSFREHLRAAALPGQLRDLESDLVMLYRTTDTASPQPLGSKTPAAQRWCTGKVMRPRSGSLQGDAVARQGAICVSALGPLFLLVD